MKTKTTIGLLAGGIGAVLRATDGKCAKITINKKNLVVEASGPDGYAKHVVDVEELGAQGTASIESSVFSVVFGRESQSAEVTIEPVKDGLALRFGGSRIKLRAPDNDPIQLFTEAKGKHEAKKLFAATGKEIKEAISAATEYAATHDVRPFLVSVLISNFNEKLRVSASDGFIFHRLDTDLPLHKEAGDFAVLLPLPTAKSMCSVFSPEEMVTVRLLGDNLVEFITEKMTWVSRLVCGKFPSTDRFLSTESKSKDEVIVSRDDLLVALARIKALEAGEGAKKTVLGRAKFADGTLTLNSTDNEQIINLSCAKMRGMSDDFSYTCTILARAISAIPTTKVLIRKDGADPKSFIFMRPCDDEDKPMKNWVATAAPANI